MRKFYIKRLQTIKGQLKFVYIKRLVNHLNHPKFFPADCIKIATIFNEHGIKEFQLLGALPNIEYTVVEIDSQGSSVNEFSLTSFN